MWWKQYKNEENEDGDGSMIEEMRMDIDLKKTDIIVPISVLDFIVTLFSYKTHQNIAFVFIYSSKLTIYNSSKFKPEHENE